MSALRFDTEQEYARFLTAYQGRKRGTKETATAPQTLGNEPTSAKRERVSRIRACATEDQEQSMLIEWVRINVHTYPALAILAHIPNGGSRHVLEAKKLKRLGVLPGMPDLLLLYPARGFHGWAGEMKAQDGKLTERQREVLVCLRTHGYFAEAFYGWKTARDNLLWYLTESEAA